MIFMDHFSLTRSRDPESKLHILAPFKSRLLVAPAPQHWFVENGRIEKRHLTLHRLT
jgi:hypothetical protein